MSSEDDHFFASSLEARSGVRAAPGRLSRPQEDALAGGSHISTTAINRAPERAQLRPPRQCPSAPKKAATFPTMPLPRSALTTSHIFYR